MFFEPGSRRPVVLKSIFKADLVTEFFVNLGSQRTITLKPILTDCPLKIVHFNIGVYEVSFDIENQDC